MSNEKDTFFKKKTKKFQSLTTYSSHSMAANELKFMQQILLLKWGFALVKGYKCFSSM